ncbi:MAG: hypothetical protein ACTSX9_06750 [Candidatus Njordarchaeales archaeon]
MEDVETGFEDSELDAWESNSSSIYEEENPHEVYSITNYYQQEFDSLVFPDTYFPETYTEETDYQDINETLESYQRYYDYYVDYYTLRENGEEISEQLFKDIEVPYMFRSFDEGVNDFQHSFNSETEIETHKSLEGKGTGEFEKWEENLKTEEKFRPDSLESKKDDELIIDFPEKDFEQLFSDNADKESIVNTDSLIEIDDDLYDIFNEKIPIGAGFFTKLNGISSLSIADESEKSPLVPEEVIENDQNIEEFSSLSDLEHDIQELEKANENVQEYEQEDQETISLNYKQLFEISPDEIVKTEDSENEIDVPDLDIEIAESQEELRDHYLLEAPPEQEIAESVEEQIEQTVIVESEIVDEFWIDPFEDSHDQSEKIDESLFEKPSEDTLEEQIIEELSSNEQNEQWENTKEEQEARRESDESSEEYYYEEYEETNEEIEEDDEFEELYEYLRRKKLRKLLRLFKILPKVKVEEIEKEIEKYSKGAEEIEFHLDEVPFENFLVEINPDKLREFYASLPRERHMKTTEFRGRILKRLLSGKQKHVQIKILKYISHRLGVSLRELERRGIIVSWPIRVNKRIAFMLATHILNEGYMRAEKEKFLAGYVNKDPILVLYVILLMRKITTKKKIRVYLGKDGSIHVQGSWEIMSFLLKLGVPLGNKAVVNPPLPEDILKDKNLALYHVRTTLAEEGILTLKLRGRKLGFAIGIKRAVSIPRTKNERLESLRKRLLSQLRKRTLPPTPVKKILREYQDIENLYTQRLLESEKIIFSELEEKIRQELKASALSIFHERLAESYKTRDERVGLSYMITIESKNPATERWIAIRKFLEIVYPLSYTLKFWRFQRALDLFERYGGEHLDEKQLNIVESVRRILSPRTPEGKILHELFILKNLDTLIRAAPEIPQKYNVQKIAKYLLPLLLKILGEEILIRILTKIIERIRL